MSNVNCPIFSNIESNLIINPEQVSNETIRSARLEVLEFAYRIDTMYIASEEDESYHDEAIAWVENALSLLGYYS